MREVYDCAVPADRERGLDAAARAIGRGHLVVVPTDTVYGVAADAFTPAAVSTLLAAKGRDRSKPPPVLVGDLATLDGLARDIPPAVRALVEAFWPGGLTIVCMAQSSLQWDLGDTGGTVALRMPLHPVALELLARTGPLATSSANTTGSPAALSMAAAEEMLGDSVQVYLDGGPCLDGESSTIVEATGPELRVLRAGAIAEELLREVVPDGWATGPVADGPVADEPVAAAR